MENENENNTNYESDYDGDESDYDSDDSDYINEELERLLRENGIRNNYDVA